MSAELSPRQRFLNLNPREAEYQASKLKTIGDGISKFKRDVDQFGTLIVAISGDAVKIGDDILDLCNRLPGKEMTVDFWNQIGDAFEKTNGYSVTFRQLQCFVRISQGGKNISTVQEALSYRKDYLEAAGIELLCGHVGITAHHPDHYLKLIEVFDVKKLEKRISGLVSDEHFGDIENWDEDRKERVRLHMQPFKRRLDELCAKLEPKLKTVGE